MRMLLQRPPRMCQPWHAAPSPALLPLCGAIAAFDRLHGAIGCEGSLLFITPARNRVQRHHLPKHAPAAHALLTTGSAQG